KGGVNLRFFFRSIRYSEDMDLDISGIGIGKVQKTVVEILLSRGFLDSLRSFGIQKIVPPDILKAKQTEGSLTAEEKAEAEALGAQNHCFLRRLALAPPLADAIEGLARVPLASAAQQTPLPIEVEPPEPELMPQDLGRGRS
ncbi:MAG: hypothetical protein AABZ26_02560, partial [Chloroflexota bacterium]